jgi:hypothetical protein
MYTRDYTLEGQVIVEDYGEAGMIGKLEIWSMFERPRKRCRGGENTCMKLIDS